MLAVDGKNRQLHCQYGLAHPTKNKSIDWSLFQRAPILKLYGAKD